MLRIHPFAAIRPQPNEAARVASVPYDVVNAAEARTLAAGNPLSFLHIIRPEIDLPEGTNSYDDSVYAMAEANFERFRQEGTLVQDTEPHLYLYRQVFEHRQQIGLVCCCHIDDYANDVIKKHEKTREDKEDDRTRHLLALNAHTGPVFLTYRGQPEIDELIELDSNSRPLFHFNAPDGVTHTVWRARSTEPYMEAFRRVPCAYVADGHHRSASAARAGAQRRAENPDHTEDAEYDWFLTVLFAADQLAILPYNRVLKDLNGQSGDEILERLRGMEEVSSVTETDEATPDRAGVFCLLLEGRWHRVELSPDTIDATDPVGGLDVALVERCVLGPIFGIGDIRTDPRIDFVGGIRGTSELEKRVTSGAAAAAVSLYPTTIEQLMTVADSDMIMPPKSTWFEPKLRSGLFVHSLEAVPTPA